MIPKSVKGVSLVWSINPMKRKRNIYDADDAARSKRLRFSAEERAAHAEKKAEVLGQKLEKAKAEVPSSTAHG